MHNSLIISILGTSLHHAPPTPPPDTPGNGKPPRKRRRILPHQDFGIDAESGMIRSPRLKRWTVGMGRKERERIKAFQAKARAIERGPREETDEIARERGVVLLREGRGMYDVELLHYILFTGIRSSWDVRCR